MIARLKEHANKYKVLFNFVRDVNHQVRDSNMKLYAHNDALKRKNKQLLCWKAARYMPVKRLNAKGLALQFQKCSPLRKHGIEVLIKTIGL